MLGFVNRFSHGVLRVNRELSTNGNGSPEYNLGLRTALLVIVHNANCEISGDVKIVYDLIRADVKLSQPEISKRVSFSTRKVSTIIKVLKDSGYIKRVGSNKTGHWEVLK